MGNSQFRKPLTQSAAILCSVVVIIALLSSSSPGASILAFFSGLGNLILLLIGLSIALPLSIAILVAIFLGAVSIQSREKAAEMYSDLKNNLPLITLPFINRWLCCNNESNTSISQEEYNLMEQEITHLKEANVILETKIKELNAGNIAINKNLSEVTEQNRKNIADVTDQNSKDLAEVTEENTALKEQLNELSQSVIKLQGSEKELSEVITTLKTQFDEIDDSELRTQIESLELHNTETNTNIDTITGRLTALEKDNKLAPTSGIFSYIKNDSDKNVFIKVIQEAISQEMTYSQIDEFLSKNIEPGLNKIIKDHPSLTKNYIRNLKKE